MFNLTSKYGLSLFKDKEGGTACYLLLIYLENYVNGAIIEMRRLSRIRKLINKEFQKPLSSKTGNKNKVFHLTYLSIDTHFYFICIDKVYKLTNALAKELDDLDIGRLVIELEKVFDIQTVRGHLEHIEQRCLGRFPRNIKVAVAKNDLGNFIGDSFSFGGKKFPSGVESIINLKKIYVELIGILEKKYASKDPAYVWRQQSEAKYKQIMRILEKKGFLS